MDVGPNKNNEYGDLQLWFPVSMCIGLVFVGAIAASLHLGKHFCMSINMHAVLRLMLGLRLALTIGHRRSNRGIRTGASGQGQGAWGQG